MSDARQSEEYAEAEVELVGLPEAADRLGLHRATLNAMVHNERIPATRYGPHWYIRRPDLEDFASRYRRPANSPIRRRKTDEPPPAQAAIMAMLDEWDEATSEELAAVIGLHVGNIRKHLRLLEAKGLAIRTIDGVWRPS